MRLFFAVFSTLLRLLLYPLLLFRRHLAAPKGAYVELVIRGRVLDILPRPPLFAWRRRPMVSVLSVRELAQEILRDDRVKGVVVRIDSVKAGMATVESLRAIPLTTLREANRDVVAYLPFGGDTKETYLAAAANRIILGPQTAFAPLGFAVGTSYVRAALDRVGLVPDVLARGTYKSAGEQLVRTSMSDAQREQTGAILDTLYDALVAGIATGRKTDEAQARSVVDGAPYGARAAVAAGLADATAYEDEMRATLVAGAPRTHIVAAARYGRARRATTFAPIVPRGVIGVVRVHGPIVHEDGDSRMRFATRVATDTAVGATLRRAREDRRVRGVILHIDSPGGSVLASDRIHHEVLQLAAKKPVVACMAEVAASGGYYVAAPAHAIVAQPTTITGSIGVVAARVAFEPLFARMGVVREVIKRGARADLVDWMHPLSDDERGALMREVAAFYDVFVRIVADGRKRSVDEVERVAEGRVWTGRDAHSHGLVDVLGGFDVALRLVRERVGAGARDLRPVVLPVPRRASMPSMASTVAFETLVQPVTALLGADAAFLALALSSKESVYAWSPIAAALAT